MNPPERLALTVVGPPGLESITRAEIEALGGSITLADSRRAPPGHLFVEADPAGLCRLNIALRTASRVLVRFEPFQAAAFSELHKKAGRLPWENYLEPGRPLRVRVTTAASALYHKKGVAERVVAAASDRLGKASLLTTGEEEDVEDDAALVMVQLFRNHCLIQVDSSGAPLHRRGYRLAVAKAPLREHLAAALIMASGWPGSVPLVDPFCGSGTLMIEAAMMAAGMPPGLRRRFAFEAWAGYPEALAVARSRLPTDRPSPPPMFGFDRDAGAIKAARANAERAGVEGLIEWRAQSISDLALPEGTPGWMVTNPPYGERVKGGRDLRDLYARLGSVWRTRAASWHKFYVCSSPRWSGQLGMTSKPVVSFSNGGLPVTLMEAHESKEQS